MVLWLIKQFLNIKNVLAGRNRPHQMAWGLAFGLLLGLIPHGNLLTVVLVGFVVCLNVNHAMVTLVGIAVTFLATRLDPYSHQVGQFVLLHPSLVEPLANAWQLPLMAWTDLNNTIVMGSFLIGVAALLPVYAISFPLFRLIAPKQPCDETEPTEAIAVAQQSEPIAERQQTALASAASKESEPIVFTPLPGREPVSGPATPKSDIATSDIATSDIATAQATEENATATVETQIDVIRLKDYRADDPESGSETPATPADNAQINQALNYLLRRLRTSQQENAA